MGNDASKGIAKLKNKRNIRRPSSVVSCISGKMRKVGHMIIALKLKKILSPQLLDNRKTEFQFAGFQSIKHFKKAKYNNS